MNTRNVVKLLIFIVCIGCVWGVFVQRQELANLRAEQQRLAGLQASSTDPAAEAAVDASATPGEPMATGGGSSELLRLRAEVTRLSTRKRELAGLPETVERLRSQVASSLTNAATGTRLPSGYIRKNQARMVGYETPEKTMQSFLWALQNHDFTNVLQALTPEAAEQLQAEVQRAGSTEGFFKAADILPGLGIQSREQLPNGGWLLQTQIAPGIPPQKFKVEQINGLWKLSEH